MKLDKTVDLFVAGNGNVHVTAKAFFLNGTRTAVGTLVSGFWHNVADMLPVRMVGHTFMIDLAARLQKIQLGGKAFLCRRILETLSVGIVADEGATRTFDVAFLEPGRLSSHDWTVGTFVVVRTAADNCWTRASLSASKDARANV